MVSLRAILASSAVVFTGLVGTLAFSLTWTASLDEIDRIAAMLRESTIAVVTKSVGGVTDGAMQQAVRMAQGVHANTEFGCCNPNDTNSLSVFGFPEVRHAHWLNVVSNPNILLSYSASSSGALLLLHRSADRRDLDGTLFRDTGNLRWGRSDLSTGFALQRYWSNTWEDGGFGLSQDEFCRYGGTRQSQLRSAITDQSLCAAAAEYLSLPPPVITATASGTSCFFDAGEGATFWNPVVGTSAAAGVRALCQHWHYFQVNKTWVPHCIGAEPPCRGSGHFTYFENPLFNESLYADGRVYDARERAWWKGAVKNVDPSSAFCQEFSDCRTRPSWSAVYLSLAAAELVLPGVHIHYVGSSNVIQSMQVVAVGLSFMEGVMESEVNRVSTLGQGFIADMAGKVLASTPTGLSTAIPQEQSTTGSMIAVAAVNVTGGDGFAYRKPHAAHLQDVARQALARYGGTSAPESIAAQELWAELPSTLQFSVGGTAVLGKRLKDDYGLNWMVFLSFPDDVFLGDLPARRDFTIGMIVALTVALALILLMITQLVSMDLTRLAKEMEKCAVMKLEQVHVGRRSCLSELQWMETNFYRMHHNLKEYRLFLPGTILADREDPVLPVVQPPGTDDPDVPIAICFTDIESSTVLWEAHSQLMQQSLLIHNAVIRVVAAESNGYEVKTMGDAFMLAFLSPRDAVKFGIEVQSALVREVWPPDLLKIDMCAKVHAQGKDELLWNGPRVRAGINFGDVRVHQNPITGRLDYFGSTVNVASRVEAAMRFGGLTGITRNVYDVVELDLKPLDGFAWDMGLRTLKGVTEQVQVYGLLPLAQAERKTVLLDSANPLEPLSPKSEARQAFENSSARSSTTTLSFEARARDDVIPHLQLKLQQRRISCASVRGALTPYPAIEAAVERLLVVVEHACNVSQGLVAEVLSASCIAVWNGLRPCQNFLVQCQAFYERVQLARPPCHIGLTSGSAMCGNVASGQRRVPTVVSGCIELGRSLAEEAAVCAERGFAAGLIAHSFAANGAAHRVQVWTVRDVGSFVVWQLLAEDAHTDKWEALLKTPVTTDLELQSSVDPEELFVDAVRTGDYQRVQDLANTGDAWVRFFVQATNKGSVKHRIVAPFHEFASTTGKGTRV
eukprot:TRINITY_DN7288_c0_g2_i1.p1 TRINITY_DN7288_c0_g2~~TRINITY_DN7288_c0_g2_i1.p1  ORF type:complete len:1130 (+),score=259.28 TRINITY_DN7288_c0_g2_i1:90-3479(+)